MAKKIALITSADYGLHEHLGMSLVIGVFIPQLDDSIQGSGFNLIDTVEIARLYECFQAECSEQLIGKPIWIDSEGLGSVVKYLKPCKME